MGALIPMLISPAAITTLLSFGVQVAGQIQASRAAQAQAAYQAAVARNNQILAERAAQDALARGRAEAAKQGVRTRQFIARQRTALAGAGQLVDVGSGLDLTADTAAAGRLEELTIRRNAEREALGFRTQGMNFAAEAQLARLRGQAARRALPFGIAGTLLTSAEAFRKGWPKKRIPTIRRISSRQVPTALQLSGPF